MASTNITESIQRLQDERDTLDDILEKLRAMASGNGTGERAPRAAQATPRTFPAPQRAAMSQEAGQAAPKRRGRPPNALPAASAAPTGLQKAPTSQRAPKGLLKETIHKALKGAKGPLTPAVLMRECIKLGYPTTNPKSLYTAVFIAAKKDPAIKKTKDGLSLKSSK